jgi:DNA-binding transcriptional LysR family regulator
MPSRGLPSLDLLKGFEAAARNLSFTKAAAELFVTQSAISRQIKTLEDQLGMALFRRRHRELLLTEQGQTLYKAAGQALQLLRDATGALSARRAGMITVTSSIGFAALWLVPRLNDFMRAHPGIDVRLAAATQIQDLEREGIDLAIRYCTPAMTDGKAVRLFGERVFPVCAVSMLGGRTLKSPQDLSRHVLLHYDDPARRFPWLQWDVWFELVKAQNVTPAGTLRFSHYDQLIQAALEGQGIALGRSPLVERWMKEGRLIQPFGRRYPTLLAGSRAYFIVVAEGRAARPEVAAFSRWLQDQAKPADEK